LSARAKLDWVVLVSMPLLMLALASYFYDLLLSWFAPRCETPSDLEGWWCLPIGWSGPFSDIWSNRSFFNSRVDSTINFIIWILIVGLAIHVFFIRRSPRGRRLLLFASIGALLFMIVKALCLNNIS
jgi:hypothetical protein